MTLFKRATQVALAERMRSRPSLDRAQEAFRAGRFGPVVLLGSRQGKFLFAAALRDKAIVVFDEDGTLLDQARVPGDKSGGRYHVFAFGGGEVGPDRGAITIDTNLGDYLFEVDLGE